MKRLGLMLGVVAALIPVAVQATTITTAKVVRLADGDTATVDNGLISDIRIACIDAPEVPHSKKEAQSTDTFDLLQYKWGRLAQARVSNLLASTNAPITIKPVGVDRYGRNIAAVEFREGSDWATTLVGEGLAFVYEQYTTVGCDKSALLAAQAAAKNQKLGVWGEAEPVMVPWEFRKRS